MVILMVIGLMYVSLSWNSRYLQLHAKWSITPLIFILSLIVLRFKFCFKLLVSDLLRDVLYSEDKKKSYQQTFFNRED